MLKKAGIIAACATASLLALSPLAFADPGKDHKGYPHGGPTVVQNNGVDESNTANGLLAGVNALNNNEVNVPINACDNNLNGPLAIQLADITGAAGLLGGAGAVNGTSCEIANGSGGLQGNSISH